MRPGSGEPGGAPPRGDLRPMGTAVFLASLGTLLGAAMAGTLVMRLRAETWPPAGVSLPRALWLSTALLLGVSLSLRGGIRGIRRGSAAALRRGFLLATALALAFLASQTLAVVTLLGALAGKVRGLFAFCFLFLTGLHAVHVLGGLAPLLVADRRALRGEYHAEDHTGARLVANYWHFLDVVWLAMLALLVL